ncbi:hypothetical protein PMAYCL1PPCAC_07582, partial [Pristionchus mayeri]
MERRTTRKDSIVTRTFLRANSSQSSLHFNHRPVCVLPKLQIVNLLHETIIIFVNPQEGEERGSGDVVRIGQVLSPLGCGVNDADMASRQGVHPLLT